MIGDKVVIESLGGSTFENRLFSFVQRLTLTPELRISNGCHA